MNLDGAKNFLKEHWVILAGGIAGIYLVMHFVGGNSAASSSGATSTNASDAAAAAAQASNMLASQQLQDQSNAAARQAEVGQTAAVGGVIGNIGSAITSVIAAQSVIPAAAINAASVNNQAALLGAAQVASAGFTSLPSDLNSMTSMIGASYTPLAVLGQSLIGLNDHIGSLGEAAVNAVGSSVSSSAGSAAQSAAASAAANAAATSAVAGAVSTTAKVAMA